jgi:glycosyltransferase involved in cell wall biosynthesis
MEAQISHTAINLFFVVHNFSGAKTYVDELSLFLTGNTDVNVYKVYLKCVGHKEFSTENINSSTCIYLPEKVTLEYDPLYYRRAAQLVFSNYRELRNVILHANMPEQFYFVKEAKEFFQCPVVFTCHFLIGSYSCYDKITGYSGENIDKVNVLEEFVTELADQAVCVTEFGRHTLANIHKLDLNKKRVIYNGKSVPNLPENSKVTKLRYGFAQKDQLILYAGQLDPMKGVDKLIEAFLISNNSFSKIKLMIAGHGYYDRYIFLAQQCIGWIYFMGNLDNDTFNKFYRFSDVGVIPSQCEQCTYVAIGMMQNKLPVIISDTPGLNELITHKITGLICRIQPHSSSQNLLEVDVTDLALQIQYKLVNNAEAKEKAYNQVSVYNSLINMGEATLDIYQKLNKGCD